MNAELRTWIIEYHEKLPTETKRNFFRTIRFAPDKMLQAIRLSLNCWRTYAALEARRDISVDFIRDPEEILEALKEHFAKDMAAITQ